MRGDERCVAMPEPLLKVLLLHPTQHSRPMASDGEETAAKAEKSDLILLAPQSGAHIITPHRDPKPIPNPSHL